VKSIESLTVDEARAAAIFRALGNPARIRILRELAAHPGCMTGELTTLLPLAQSTVSEHLRVLKETGVVQGKIDGDRCYCLVPGTLAGIIAFCEELLGSAGCAPADEERCC
jgi:ArsR family transcriptional regulator